MEGDARVDDPIPVLKLEPTDDAGVDDHAQPDLFVETFRELALDAIAVRPLELDRCGHDGADATGRVVGQALKLLLDRPRFVGSPRFDEQPGQVGGFAVEQVRGRRNKRIPPLGCDRRVAQHRGDVRIAEQFTNLGETAGPLVEVAV